jgi:hypothetical protein
MGAHMSAASHTVPAPTAYDMSFARHNLANMEISHIRPHLYNFANEFVPDDYRYGDRFLGLFVPFPDVYVGTAYCGTAHTDKYVIDSSSRQRYVIKRQSWAWSRFY